MGRRWIRRQKAFHGTMMGPWVSLDTQASSQTYRSTSWHFLFCCLKRSVIRVIKTLEVSLGHFFSPLLYPFATPPRPPEALWLLWCTGYRSHNPQHVASHCLKLSLLVTNHWDAISFLLGCRCVCPFFISSLSLSGQFLKLCLSQQFIGNGGNWQFCDMEDPSVGCIYH